MFIGLRQSNTPPLLEQRILPSGGSTSAYRLTQWPASGLSINGRGPVSGMLGA